MQIGSILRSFAFLAIAVSCGPASSGVSGTIGPGGAAPGADGSTRTIATPSCPSHPAPGAAGPRPNLVLQDGHARNVLALALSGDGRVLASSGIDGVVRVWDTRSGLLMRRVGTGGTPMKIGLAADGSTLAYYAPSGGALSIGVVDLGSGAPARNVGQGNVGFGLSPDGRTIAVGTAGLQLYDATSGATLRNVDLPLITAVTYDGAGRRIAAATMTELVIVDVATGAVTRRWAGPASAQNPVAKLAFVGDVLALRQITGLISLVSIKEGGPTTPIPGSFTDMSAASGKIITVDQRGQLDVWDAATGKSMGVVAAASPMQQSVVAISADGGTIAMAGDTSASARAIRILDGKTLQAVRTMEGRTSGITALGLSSSGEELATGSVLGATTRWNLGSGEPMGTSAPEEMDPTRSVSFDDAGATIATVGGSYFVRVRDAKTGKVLRQWNAHENHAVRFASFLPGTTELITAGSDGAVRRWDLGARPEPAPPRAHRFTEFGKPPGKLLGSADFPVRSAVLAPDGWRIAALGDAGQVAVIGLQDGTVRWETKLTTMDPINGLWIGWTSDGSKLFASSKELKPNDKGIPLATPTLRVLGSQSGQVEQELRPGTAGPLAARGTTIAIGGAHPALLGPKLTDVRPIAGIPDQEVRAVSPHPKRDLFVFGGDGGATSFVPVEAASASVFLVSTPNGEYVAATPEGAFRSSLDGARSIAWTFDAPLEAFTFEQFVAKLGKPEIVAARLADKSAAAPASVARPPMVTIAGGSAPRTVAAKSILLRASVASRFVEDLRVFVNGRPVADKAVCAPKGDVDVDVPLVGGRNRVSLVAYDADGFASNTQAIDVISSAAGAARPELWVVAVGVSHYPKLPPELELEVANADARSVAEAMAAEVGAGKPYAALHETTLTDEKATVQGITSALDKLAGMRPDDLAVVFFAGHGVKIEDDKMVFLTSTATLTKQGARESGVGWSVIEASLAKAKGHVLVLLDACHSGHVSTDIIAPNEELARELSAEGRSGVLVFAASRGAELSYEVSAGGGASRGLELAWSGRPPQISSTLPAGHGLFTSALLDALSGGAPDRDGSGAVEAGELIDFVTERVRNASNGMQTPWVARREMFGDFPVAVPKR